MKPNDWPVTSRPKVTPQMAIGTTSQIISGWRTRANSNTVTSTMARYGVASVLASACCASLDCS